MKDIENSEEILSQHIFGFHIYSFSNPFHVTYANDSLCNMLKVHSLEIVDKKDKYINFVHSEDKAAYKKFLEQLSKKEQTLSLQYRLVSNNGAVIYVNDTMSSKLQENGEMVAYSTLNDMTELITDKRDLFLGKGNPCGFVKYTCEKQPKITYMNKKMMEILKIPPHKDGELDYSELYTSNIYLIIPVEERKKFHHLLNRVLSNAETITGELTLLRCDGTKVRVFGWITKQINEQGEPEFQSVMLDVSDKYYQQKESEIDIYINSLSQVYDKIFVYDYANKTVKYVYGKNSKTSLQFKNMPVNMDDAIQQFVKVHVDKKDQAEVQEFFNENYERRFNPTDFKPIQTRFRAKFTDGISKLYSGIFLKINLTVSLLCVRSFEELDSNALRTENISLRNMQENMQKLFMRLTEGIVAFEINQNKVKLMHTSENVCRFLGYTKEELDNMMQAESLTIDTIISKSEILNSENVNKLLMTGEAEFPYYDVAIGRNRRIKALCTQESIDDTKARFVILYNVPEIKNNETIQSEKPKVYIRTFGYFDIFVNDKPIAFKNKKSKELLALLVDRRGGFVTSEEAISYLWEDEDANPVTLARYRKVALRLKNMLEEYGIVDIIESIDGKRRIDTNKVECDLYNYLSEDDKYSQLFKGTYLTNYSWGETTLSELLTNY